VASSCHSLAVRASAPKTTLLCTDDQNKPEEGECRIVLCSLSGHRATGPWREQPAFDLAIQAVSGAMSVTGQPGEPPVRMGVSIGDL
jgi:hypothetical protein